MPNALDTYLSAIQKFQECATASMENLTKAREAYQQAVGASAEIRETLNSQGDTLDSLMTKLQDTVGLHLVRKGEPGKSIETQLEEDIPALLRRIQESEPTNAEDTNKPEVLSAPKKKIWQL